MSTESTRHTTIRTSVRLVAIASLSTLLLGAGTTPANAEIVQSAPRPFTAGPYRNVAIASTGSGPTWLSSSSSTRRLGDAMAGAFEIGAAVRLFDESGAICRSTNLTFNEGPANVYTSGWSGSGFGANCGKQKYTSVGLHSSFDGRGYVVVDSHRTPAVSWPGTEPTRSAPATNAAGETYGVSTGVDSDPDLLLAVGDGGERGYVRRTSLYPEISSRGEAAAWMAELAEHTVPSAHQPGAIEVRIEHPLLASDGSTIVGTFTSTSLLPARRG